MKKYALDKEIPRKPLNQRYVNYEDLKNILIGKCECCKWNVSHYDKYCSNCGQRLDWDTTKTTGYKGLIRTGYNSAVMIKEGLTK